MGADGANGIVARSVNLNPVNEDLDPETLIVSRAYVDEGPTIKRIRPRAQGRAFPIHKPMTHVTIVVEDKEA